MSFLYLAYGSNMLTQRLRHRCPSARPVGTAMVPGHALEFTKPGQDQSGKATLTGTAAQGVHTPGVLFEIDKVDLPSLDKAEAAGVGYDRHDAFDVLLPGTGERLAATTYLAIDTSPHLKPFDWYLALVLAGAHEHGLDARHIAMLGRTEYEVDSHASRAGRAEALKALAAHGHDAPADLFRHRL